MSTFNTCPEKRNVTFTIFPEGLEERVQVDIEHVCDCDCQLEPEAVSSVWSSQVQTHINMELFLYLCVIVLVSGHVISLVTI